MGNELFTAADRKRISARDLTEQEIMTQIELFRRGATHITLDRPVSPGDGLVQLPEALLPGLEELFAKEAAKGRATKLVPASGAASRMFELPLAWHGKGGPLTTELLREKTIAGDGEAGRMFRLARAMDRFAFFPQLAESLSRDGFEAKRLLRSDDLRPVLEHLLTERGLNYSRLPKALLVFHDYGQTRRTALAEHLVEAARYVKDEDGICRLHFTISPEHEPAMTAHLKSASREVEAQFGVRLQVSFSTQKPRTETIAVDLENRPFRDQEGELLFRPGGHGALIENLDELQGDLVFIKNIDNVVPDRLKGPTCAYKRALAGYLVLLQERIFSLLRRFDEGAPGADLVAEGAALVSDELGPAFPPAFESRPLSEQAREVRARLHRPLRVCGMVENQGDPGGGPFWVREADGSSSLQIVETAQVSPHSESQQAILGRSGYFNPVDLVCGLRDHQGRQYPLKEFVDPEAVFISEKSHRGRTIKALELPGLWNGAMSRWNTVFVEVPLATFSPVKTVFDLLRPEHQPG